MGRVKPSFRAGSVSGRGLSASVYLVASPVETPWDQSGAASFYSFVAAANLSLPARILNCDRFSLRIFGPKRGYTRRLLPVARR